MAGNPLHQWFCAIAAMHVVRAPSKSELQRYAHWLPAPEMRAIVDGLLRVAADEPARLELKVALDLEACFLDGTALKANIHFPTAWVILRDAVRSIMKATILIRRKGLRERMEPPAVVLARMNKLSMDMSQAARRAGSKKARKRVLRQMKRMVAVVASHARRHHGLLGRNWEETSWNRAQAEVVLKWIDGVLELLPRARSGRSASGSSVVAR